MQLGELLSLGQRPGAALQAWLRNEDMRLEQELQHEANLRGETLDQFVRIAVSDFMAEADEGAWADLVSALRDARDPGAACVSKVARFRLRMEHAP